MAYREANPRKELGQPASGPVWWRATLLPPGQRVGEDPKKLDVYTRAQTWFSARQVFRTMLADTPGTLDAERMPEKWIPPEPAEPRPRRRRVNPKGER